MMSLSTDNTKKLRRYKLQSSLETATVQKHRQQEKELVKGVERAVLAIRKSQSGFDCYLVTSWKMASHTT